MEIPPALANNSSTSLDTGTLPNDWRIASIGPIFLKATNIWPVTKIENHHGFCKSHSCESQLISTIHDIMQVVDSKEQTDLIILDFSIAFDTVTQMKLLFKHNKCGINGSTSKLIQSFLMPGKQQVNFEGESSKQCSIESGVSICANLRSLLFCAT